MIRSPRFAVLALLLVACGGNDAQPDGAARVVLDLDSAHDTPDTFWDLPFPLDLRLTATGAPDMTGFYSKGPTTSGGQLLAGIASRRGFPMQSIAYFRFDKALAPRVPSDVIPADKASPFLLIDIDPESPDKGTLLPTVAQTLEVDNFAPPSLIGVAPRPGIILRGDTTYAVVMLRSANDSTGAPLAVNPTLARLMAGGTPAGAAAAGMAALFGPLLTTLDTLGVPRTDVVAATVFTTGDVVADWASIYRQLLDRDHATIANPRLDPVDGVHPDYCEVQIDLTVPQYLTGTEPWEHEGGVWQLGADDLPVKQSDRTVPAVLTVPRRAMPAAGFPILLYFHGSGGLHDQVIDASRSMDNDDYGAPGEGPAMWYAKFGLAAAGSPSPNNPERVPGASEQAYIPFNNLGVFPFIAHQGVVEQGMFLSALLAYQLDPAVLTGCDGVILPQGQTAVKYDPDRVYYGGQSLGAVWVNLSGAVDPRPKAFVATGAGGYWSLMVLASALFADLTALLPPLLGTNAALTFMHPGMFSLQLAWEGAETFVHMARLSRRPLPGYPARPIYEPVGKDDEYFATTVYDAVALAYGNQQAGDMVWPDMQSALALEDRDGLATYPVSNNLTSENGDPYTGVVVQYEDDGLIDAHYIYRQLDAVIYQYSCFLETMIATGQATVPAPAALGTPCPGL